MMLIRVVVGGVMGGRLHVGENMLDCDICQIIYTLGVL